MKLFVFACVIAAVAAAPPVGSSADAAVLRFDNDNIGTGSYNYVYEQSDGTKAEAHGELKDANSENAFIAVKGSYEYVGPDGVSYNVAYTADENGYRPTLTQGAGGVIPDEVIKSLPGQ